MEVEVSDDARLPTTSESLRFAVDNCGSEGVDFILPYAEVHGIIAAESQVITGTRVK